MTRLHPLRATATILLAAFGLAAAATQIPDNAYQRWQLLHATIYDSTRWIYERCRFDPTPIDVAVVGTSRTRQGVNAPRLEADLAARGISAHTVNFSILSPGRGADLAVVDELLARKRPKLLIIGIQEHPDRNEHDAFRYIAPREQVVTPSLWRRLSYFGDLGYAPFRQLLLLFARLFPDVSQLPARFNPAAYAGTSVDTTGGSIDEGAATINADIPGSIDALEASSRAFSARMDRQRRQTARLERLLDADDRAYLDILAGEARRQGVQVAFLYVPYFQGPAGPDQPAIYDGFGPVWRADFVSSSPQWWADFVHLDRDGADHLTDWLADPVASALAAQQKASSHAG
jgi:hypothetical protein